MFFFSNSPLTEFLRHSESETTVHVTKSCLFLSSNKAVALKLQHVERLNTTWSSAYFRSFDTNKGRNGKIFMCGQTNQSFACSTRVSHQFNFSHASVLRANLLWCYLIFGFQQAITTNLISHWNWIETGKWWHVFDFQTGKKCHEEPSIF